MSGDKLAQIAVIRNQYGLPSTLKWIASRAAKKLLRLEISEMVWLDVDRLPAEFEANPDFTFRFLSVDEVEQLTREPEYQLMPEFVSRAALGIDKCFAAIDRNGQVAHYGWYALDSIEGAHHLGVALSFPDDVAYMYNAFTLPQYRGRRLHATAMGLALRELSELGITKLLSAIEWTNYASLRSFQRLGFINLGRQWNFGAGNSRANFSPKAARMRGVRFGQNAWVQSRTASISVVATI